MKFHEAVSEYKLFIKVTRSKGTKEYYSFYFNKLIKHFGNMDCEEIDNKRILMFIQSEKSRNNKLTNATINKSIQTLKTVLKYSCNIELNFSKLKEQKKVIEVISADTIKRIFQHYERNQSNKFSLRNYLYLRLLYDTGLRLSEMNNLTRSNLDLSLNLIHVRVTKTDLDRYVMFTEETKKVLIKYLLVTGVTDYLFINFNNGEMMTKSSVTCFIQRIRSKLKIKETILPHKWRHTFATSFIRNGGDLETLRLILGHTNLRTTQKYMHLSKLDLISNYRKVMDNS